MGSHYRSNVGVLDCLDKRWEVKLAKLPLGHIHRSCIESAGRFASADKVLCAGKYVAAVDSIAALKSPYHIFSHLAHEICIFSEGFSHTSPACISCYVKVWSEGPAHAGLPHLVCCLGPDPLNKIGVKGRSESKIGRIYGTSLVQSVSVNGIDTYEKRNLQPAFLSHFLETDCLVDGKYVEE